MQLFYFFVFINTFFRYYLFWGDIMNAFASDFDGTLYLLEIEGNYKQSDLNKIKEFQKQGHLFGICTGRPLIGIVENLKDKVNLDFYIVSSGALILDRDFNVIDEQLISSDVMKDLYYRYKDIVDIFIQGKAMYAFKRNKEVNILQTLIKDIDEVEGNVYGLSFNAKTEKNAKRVCKEIKYYYNELDAFQNKEYIDIVKKGCSKGIAINKVKEAFNIDIIAGIGDSYNDIPMLENADISFTFHSSPDVIKDKATYIVDSICEAIEKL